MFNRPTSKNQTLEELRIVEKKLKKFNRDSLLKRGYPKFLVDQQHDYYLKNIQYLKDVLRDFSRK